MLRKKKYFTCTHHTQTVRTHGKSSEIRFLLAREYFQRCRLADTVRPDQSQHFALPRRGQPVQFERIFRVPVRGVLLQVAGQVNDRDGFERTLFHANTATDAQLLGYRGYLVVRGDFYAQFSHPDDGTRFLALLAASFRFALVVVYDGDPDLFVRLLDGLIARHPAGSRTLQAKKTR